jgi:hypothetical protein
MSHTTEEDWPEGYIIVVPHAWRGDDLWRDMQSEAQERIGTTLREMYAELIHRPLPPGLEGLVHQIGTSSETRSYEC